MFALADINSFYASCEKGLYFPSATGTAVTQLVYVKFLPSRLLSSPVHTSSLHRRYKIYNVNWD